LSPGQKHKYLKRKVFKNWSQSPFDQVGWTLHGYVKDFYANT